MTNITGQFDNINDALSALIKDSEGKQKLDKKIILDGRSYKVVGKTHKTEDTLKTEEIGRRLMEYIRGINEKENDGESIKEKIEALQNFRGLIILEEGSRSWWANNITDREGRKALKMWKDNNVADQLVVLGKKPSPTNSVAENQYLLAKALENNIYKKGDIQTQNDIIYWYKQAALHGNANAQFELGKIYENEKYGGITGELSESIYNKDTQKWEKNKSTNLEEAAYWYEKAARHGKIDGYLNLAKSFSKMASLLPSDKRYVYENKEIYFYEKAYKEAKKHDKEEIISEASYALGQLSEKDNDIDKAIYYYKEANKGRDVNSKLAKLYNRRYEKTGNDSDKRLANFYTNPSGN